MSVTNNGFLGFTSKDTENSVRSFFGLTSKDKGTEAPETTSNETDTISLAEHKKELTALKSANTKEVNSIKKAFEEEIASIKDESKESIKEITSKLKAEIDVLKDELKAATATTPKAAKAPKSGE